MLALMLCAALSLVVSRVIPLRLINTECNELGAFSVSYPRHWRAESAAYSTTLWESDADWPHRVPTGSGFEGCVVQIFTTPERAVTTWARSRGYHLRGRGDVATFLAREFGLALDRSEIVEGTVAGLPATGVTGPVAGDRLYSIIVGQGHTGSLIVVRLMGSAQEYKMSTQIWRKLLRSVLWDERAFSARWVPPLEAMSWRAEVEREHGRPW
jgi:hypothetical protein